MLFTYFFFALWHQTSLLLVVGGQVKQCDTTSANIDASIGEDVVAVVAVVVVFCCSV